MQATPHAALHWIAWPMPASSPDSVCWWALPFSPRVARLEEAGWIEALPEESGRGRKRQYRILPAGRKELRHWVARQEDPKPLRDELMVRLRAEAALGSNELCAEIERRRALHEDKLALYQRLEQRDFVGKAPTRERRLQHLVLKAGILQEELWLQISREAMEILGE